MRNVLRGCVLFVVLRMHFVDIGANIGYFSLLAAELMPRGRIISIEALPSTFDKLKENIKPLENALDKINQISGVEFDWKELSDEERRTIHGNEGHDVGVIAQEIEDVLPEIVTTRETGYKAVKYEKIVPLLIEAVKELTNRIK